MGELCPLSGFKNLKLKFKIQMYCLKSHSIEKKQTPCNSRALLLEASTNKPGTGQVATARKAQNVLGVLFFARKFSSQDFL